MENSERPIKIGRWSTGPQGGDAMEYRTPERSGIDSGFYVGDRGLPWHVALSRDLGKVPLMVEAEGLQEDEAAIRLAGLDFEVEKVPVSIVTGIGKSRHKQYGEVPGWKATVRMDTMAVLGMVKDSYKVFGIRDLAGLCRDVVDASGGLWETGGSLYGGRWVFLSMEIPNGIEIHGDPSEYRLYLLASNGHDGRRPASLSITVERAVCRNTINLGQVEAISRWTARHTSGLEGRIQAIREALGITFAKVGQWEAVANGLVEKSLVDRQVEKILEDLFPVPPRDQKEDRLPLSTYGKVLEVYQTSPSIEPIRGTAYGVLNAVTEYLDHVAVYRGRKSDAGDVKADSLVFGGPSDLKKAQTLKVLQRV